MKFSKKVSSSRRTNRRKHYTADSNSRAKIMSSTLSKDLRKRYNVRAMPIRKDDEVEIMRGANKGRSGRVVAVVRSKYAVHIDLLTRTKVNGQTVQLPFNASNLRITTLKMDASRQKVLDRKAAGRGSSTEKMDDVDE